MKLKKLLKMIDPIGPNKYIIWGEDEEEPLFKGDWFSVPLYLGDYELLATEENNGDPPVRIVTEENEHGVIILTVVIIVKE